MSNDSDRVARIHTLQLKQFSELIETLIDPDKPFIILKTDSPIPGFPLPDPLKSKRGRNGNSDRDIFIFNEYSRGIDCKLILDVVNKTPGWSRLKGLDGIRCAYLRYCKAHGKTPLSRKN
jgi:hypothetical protein